MGRILFWLGVGIALYLAWRWWQRQSQRGSPRSAPASRATQETEAMLACRVCGLNVPATEAVRAGAHAYCCDEHRREGERAN